VSLAVAEREADVAEQYAEALLALGFEVRRAGPQALSVRAIPAAASLFIFTASSLMIGMSLSFNLTLTLSFARRGNNRGVMHLVSRQ
jgi:hypothetical protein